MTHTFIVTASPASTDVTARRLMVTAGGSLESCKDYPAFATYFGDVEATEGSVFTLIDISAGGRISQVLSTNPDLPADAAGILTVTPCTD